MSKDLDINNIEEYLSSKKSEIYKLVIRDTEKFLIEKALQHSYGNRILAAKILGINRNTLSAKIKKLGIKPEIYKWESY